MEASHSGDTPVPSPTSPRILSTRSSVPPSNYLTVPSTRPSYARLSSQSTPTTNEDYESIISFDLPSPRSASDVPSLLSLVRSDQEISEPAENQRGLLAAYPRPILMSAYSPASTASDHSEYSNPPARAYRLPSFATMAPGRRISPAEKDQMIDSLRSHRVNTLVELRRIEQAFATIGSPDLTEPMTAAWSYYVNSHGLLTELRALTKNYPFSSECLEEAKRRVYSDPQSNRSWNFCWLVLSKIQNDQLIPYYARYQASLPSMWGGRVPSAEGVDQLTGAFTAEWNWAVSQMLRHWNQPPTR